MEFLAYALISLPFVCALYAYAGYPAILRLMARRRPAEVPAALGPVPFVTAVIPAYNEEAQIRGAIEGMLAQDYPREHFQLLILSDASTDGTDAIVREYANRGVELFRLNARSGKTAAENASVSSIRGQIVINSDASVRLKADAVRLLVTAMGDPTVGVASSRDVSVTGHGPEANAAEGSYVDYEMRIRALETQCGGIVGASGSGYAIRAELHRFPVREDLSRDFSAALTAARNGYRAVSVDDAVCFVPRTASLSREYKRKVRTISRGMETLFFNRDLLSIPRYGVFAWKLFSHKLMRWFVPLSAIPALVGLMMLASEHVWARWLLAVAVLLAGAAIVSAKFADSRTGILPGGIAGALTANLAVIHAAWRFFHGHNDHVWEPTRRAPPPTVAK